MNYDPRYLAGIVLFNQGDFFEAHEAWEALWMDTAGPDKAFYQGLIQAAVGLCHFCNGNVRGAVKLYRTSLGYLDRYTSPHLGLDIADFGTKMALCFAELLSVENPDRSIVPQEELIPEISLSPAPKEWPDPWDYVPKEED